jgi:hypothetical protein
MSRRRATATAAALLALVLGGCATDDPVPPWHSGRLVIGTGDTTGVFYQVGGGYADIITAHLPGYVASTAPTTGGADNLLRLATGDVQLALVSRDVAADALGGAGPFAGSAPQIRALARIHSSYAHLMVRADAGIGSVAQLRGARVSTGAVNSDTDTVALRLLAAAGLDPDGDIVRRSLTLPEATGALRDGRIDAMFWSGGLPTVGISELVDRAAIRFLPLGDLLPELERSHPGTYAAATIPAATYDLSGDVGTVSVANLLVVATATPDDLAYDLTRLIFDHQSELSIVHPEWRSVDPVTAPATEPVSLHPGAAEYYADRASQPAGTAAPGEA